MHSLCSNEWYYVSLDSIAKSISIDYKKILKILVEKYSSLRNVKLMIFCCMFVYVELKRVCMILNIIVCERLICIFKVSDFIGNCAWLICI